MEVTIKPRMPPGHITGRIGWHEGQRSLQQAQSRFQVRAIGRRWGKTMMNVWDLTTGNESRPGAMHTPQGIFWWVFPTFDLTQRGMRWWKRIMPPGAYEENKSLRMFRLPNESEIWLKSADSASLVGEGLHGMVVDEAARMPKDKWEEDLRATLSDLEGWAVIQGVPRGKNWFHSEFQRGQDPLDPTYRSFTAPTSGNPEISSNEIVESKRTLPDHIFRQEYLAEFLEDAGGVFRGVKSCIDPNLPLPDGQHSIIPPKPDRKYYAGIDLGKHVDFTVIAILDDLGRLCAWDRFNRIEWPFQRSRILSLTATYRAKAALDSTGIGDPIFDDLQRAKLPVEGFKFTNESSKILVEGLSMAIEQGDLRYPNIPELIAELQMFEYEFLPSGKLRYQAPAGCHDDCVYGLALAQWLRGSRKKGGWLA